MKAISSLNIKSVLVISLVSVLAIALLSRGYEVSSPRAHAPQQPQEQPVSRQVAAVSQNVAIAQVNEVEIDASNFRIENSLAKVDICFERISDEDWNLGWSSLEIAGNTIQSNYWALIEYRYDDSGTATHRCDVVTFPFSGSHSWGGQRCHPALGNVTQ